MPKGIIGLPYTFTALFLDTDGTPLVVNTPTIEVFYYNTSGTRVDVVAAGSVLAASSPAETGRYAYTLVVSTAYDTRVQLIGVLRGVHPVSGDTLVVERVVDLFYDASDPPPSLVVSFQRP